MLTRLLSSASIAAIALMAPLFGAPAFAQQVGQANNFSSNAIQHVLLISIDGMHAIDFENCTGGGYCPNLVALAKTGFTYTNASTSRPSDSFPGLTALVTGGTPRTTDAFYDVSYSRTLSPPAKTTPLGIVGGPNLCPGTIGTQLGFDESVDVDLTKLDAGGGIDPGFLPRDPKNGCAPVFPHQFIKVNTMFEVVRVNGGYTAWTDKHQSYELAKGPSGFGLDDFFAPEINSIPVALPQTFRTGLKCSPLPDPGAATSSNAWTDSFENIKCYDSIKVEATLNQIDGMDHTGTVKTQVPNVFGMNFQTVSVGQKLVEKSLSLTGGYLNAKGTPSVSLKDEIVFTDNAIGLLVAELKAKGLSNSTAIIVTAKHGQSAIDPNMVLRIPADDPTKKAPSAVLPAGDVLQALEDDVSLLWLKNRTPADIDAAVQTLEQNKTVIGADGGEIYATQSLGLLFNTTLGSTPDIIIMPKEGVVYTGGKKKLAEHGGFAHEDTNVMMLVSNPAIKPHTFQTIVQTMQVAPTVLKLLGLDPAALDAVRAEGTQVLPGLQ